jgi:DNA-binding transcriptional MerR regulator
MAEAHVLTVSAFARAVGVPEDTLRAYADRGLIPVQRDSANRRIFDAADVDRARQAILHARNDRAAAA